MKLYKKNYFKFILGIIVCTLVRFIPFRPPNVEPILATQMPFSKNYGGVAGFAFGFLSIVIYDFLTLRFGAWTLLTAVTYGLLGFGAFYFFKKYKNNRRNYVYFAIIGTLFFDIITGLLVGPLLFNQPFMVAVVGQIPFTLLHLLGSITFAYFLSPAIDKFLTTDHKFKTVPIINVFNIKKI